eukprot:5605336-Pyramimonas_sp.AAC.1
MFADVDSDMVLATCDAQRHRASMGAACPRVSLHGSTAAQPPHTRTAGGSDCPPLAGGVGARSASRLAGPKRRFGAPAQLA